MNNRRIYFTPRDIQKLKNLLLSSRYPTTNEILKVSQDIDKSVKNIRTWLQNARQRKIPTIKSTSPLLILAEISEILLHGKKVADLKSKTVKNQNPVHKPYNK